MAPAKNALVGGLSPLARGTLGGLPCSQLQQRFIPAGAGNSQAATRRVCAIRGLSPLARGTRDRSEIPDPIQTVYPRWRGELSKSIHLFLKHFFP